MGWSGFPLSVDDDLCLLSYFTQLRDAWYERRAVLLNPPSAPADNDALYQVTLGFVAKLQIALETCCTDYVNLSDVTAAAYFDGASSIPNHTLASWRSLAGLNASGFTRLTDSGVAYGRMQVGDIIDRHLLNELYAGIKCLHTWRLTGVACSRRGENNYVHGTSVSDQSTWALAKSTAETDFTTVSAIGNNNKPSGGSEGSYAFILPSTTHYFGMLWRIYQYLDCLATGHHYCGGMHESYWTAVAYNIGGNDPSPVYDGEGIGPASVGVYKFEEQRSLAAEDTSSWSDGPKVGNVSLRQIPPWCPTPTALASERSAGWSMDQLVGVFRGTGLRYL